MPPPSSRFYETFTASYWKAEVHRTGYFQNLKKTLPEGFDADFDGRMGHLARGLDWKSGGISPAILVMQNAEYWLRDDPSVPGYRFIVVLYRQHPLNLVWNARPQGLMWTAAIVQPRDAKPIKPIR